MNAFNELAFPSIPTYVFDQLFNATLVREGYNVSIVADWFHRIPHFDIHLHFLKNTTFDPYDNEYLESLGILVAIPGFWLILTLLFFLIFFLCRCCDANTKKKRKLTCCKLCLFLFAVISCGTISVGIVGNMLSHQGVIKVQNSTRDLANVLDDVKRNTHSIQEALQSLVDLDVDELLKLLESPLVRNATMKSLLVDHLYATKRNVTKGIKKVAEINSKVERLNFGFIPSNIEKVEQIRWPSTFAILGTLILVCLILIWGICHHSRCVLILFSVLGLLSLVVCWVFTSIYLGICVAGSDFCLDPQPFVYKQVSGVVETTIASYYLECDNSITNPFRKQIKDEQRALENMDFSILEVSNICDFYCNIPDVRRLIVRIKDDLGRAHGMLQEIQQLAQCERVHQDYISMLDSSCKEVLEGVSLMLISAAAAGFCFTLLVLCASHTWINIRKSRPLPIDAPDESDPFLPPPSTTSTASSGNSKRFRDPYGSGGSSGRPRLA